MSDYGQVQAVIVEPKGSTLAAEAAISDTSLLIDTAQDFDSDGGTLDLNGARLQYTSIEEGANPDDPDIVNLADPLALGADEDDAVGIVVGGQIPEDWYAVATMDGDGEEVHIPLTLDQRAQWIPGEYTDPVPVAVSEDMQHLEDAPGRTVTTSSFAGVLPRITVFMGINYGTDIPEMIEGSTGSSRTHPWDQVDDEKSVGVGTAFVVSTTTTQITITEPGIYAVSWSAYVDTHLADARTTTSIGIRAVPEWTDNAYDAYLMGGDPDGTAAPGSFTYYLSQGQITAGSNDISFYVTWQDLDATKLRNNYFEAMIQRIA